MSSAKPQLAALSALIALGCGPATDVPDEYRGFIDATVFDSKFLPGRCGSAPCYPSQQGYAHGAPLFFYNVGSLTTAALGTVKAADLSPVFTFGEGRCLPDSDFDPMRDAYSLASQYPIFSALPIASRVATVVVTPFVNVVPVVGTRPYACNDLKDAQAVAYRGSTSTKYNVTTDENAPPAPSLWAAIDPTAPLSSSSPDFTLSVSYGWYKDLLLTYLDGGPIPVNDKGELVAMDGVLLDPAGTASSKTTDAKVVLLPFTRGEAGYSPIVKLHNYRLPTGKALGDFTGLCTGAGTCGPKDLDVSMASMTTANTIFVVSQ